MKDKEAVKVEKETAKNRNHLMAAARDGDEEAMENLTMEDMDTYSMITQRVGKEDIFSIVDTYFMPYGIQCDQYSILGEILEEYSFKNIFTGEEIVQMTVESNNLQFDVCINRKDLLGELPGGRAQTKGNHMAQEDSFIFRKLGYGVFGGAVMNRGNVSFTFLDRVKEVELNIEDGRWQSALALALTLPDICGGIAFPDIVKRYRDGRIMLDRQKNPTRDVGAQYVRWFDEYAGDFFKISPRRCGSLYLR